MAGGSRRCQKGSTRSYRTVHKVASGATAFLEDLAGFSALAQTIKGQLPRRSQELVDLDVLRDIYKSNNGQLVAPTLKSIIEATPHDERRQETVVSFNVLLRHLHVARKCCGVCLYPKARCICGRIRIPSPLQRGNVFMLQHFGEYGRGNNSGSLLCLLAGAKRITRGILEEQAMMLNAIDDAHKRDAACVLFPSEDAIDADKFLAGREDREISLVVLDGTGNQARNLNSFMPDYIPRIRLPTKNGSTESWLNPVRKQTTSERVCTAQAVAVVLALMGETDVAEAVEDAVRVVVNDGKIARDLFHNSRRLEPII